MRLGAGVRLKVAAMAAAVCAAGALRADYFNPNTDWMQGAVGAFMHYWATPEKPDRCSTFNVPALKKQLVDMDVDFFFITLGQNSNYYCAPNDIYEDMAGYARGSRCSKRDIPGEIIEALKGTGIKVCLYTPCAPSFNDTNAMVRLGYELAKKGSPAGQNPTIPLEAVKNWAKVCKSWADRYGENVAAWWFDGAYERIGFTDEHSQVLAKAVKSANPKMVVSFNIGVCDWDPEVRPLYEAACKADPTLAARVPFREWRACRAAWNKGLPMDNYAYTSGADFTPGEAAQPFRFMTGQRWTGGHQTFMLTYIGDYWNRDNVRYGDEIWLPFLKKYLGNGGCIAFDMGKDWETGIFNAEQVAQLTRLVREAKKSLRGQ